MPRIHGDTTPSWWSGAAPPTFVSLSALTYVGAQVSFTVPGRIFGFSIYVLAGTGNDHWVVFSDTSSQTLYVVKHWKDFTIGASDRWLNTWIHPTFRVDTTLTYRVAILTGTAYFRWGSRLASPRTQNHITFLNGFQTTSIDPNAASPTFNTNANGVDVLFQPD
jgi:hypothetical protein